MANISPMENKKPLPSKGTPDWHKLQIAKKTVKMNDTMASAMGGQTKEDAIKVLKSYGLKTEVKSVKMTNDQVDEYIAKRILKEIDEYHGNYPLDDYYGAENEEPNEFENSELFNRFDADEFHGKAKPVAKKDIKKSGEEYIPFGKSEYGEVDVDDLTRQNLNLSNYGKFAKRAGNQTAWQKRKHEKMAGVGSMNELYKLGSAHENVSTEKIKLLQEKYEILQTLLSLS